MILKNLEISIFFHLRSKVFFGKNNMIVGYNGAGKSNLLKILQLLIQNPSNGFSTCYMKDEYKLDIDTHSWIKLGIKFSKNEANFLTRLLLRKNENTIINADLIFLWENPRSNQIIKYAFVLENHLVFWHAEGQDKIGFIENNASNADSIFDILKGNITLDNINIEKIKYEKDYDPNTMTENQEFQKRLFDNSLDLKDYFMFNNKSYCIYYNQKKDNIVDGPIYNHFHYPFNSSNIDIWILLSHIFSQNFIFINELRPPINDLKKELNIIKQKKSIYDIKTLQERFNRIFFDYSFDLESDDEINLTISKNNKKFKIENSASGYYENLYLLMKLYEEKDKIVILDEPTLHLHPIKQKQFWRFVSENNNGQLIAKPILPF